MEIKRRNLYIFLLLFGVLVLSSSVLVLSSSLLRAENIIGYYCVDPDGPQSRPPEQYLLTPATVALYDQYYNIIDTKVDVCVTGGRQREYFCGGTPSMGYQIVWWDLNCVDYFGYGSYCENGKCVQV
ncbi:hypothetical protein HYW75_05475 [Candidatus Pacearchaeota archaeon]|nr:hypothetical protein [Candidatus Pacearchaeota archaeon]